MAPRLNLSSLSTNSIICLVLALLLVSLPHAQSLSFNFTSFDPNSHEITFQNDSSTSSGGKIKLTNNQVDAPTTDGLGRAFYHNPVPLWDNRTGELASFTTHFSFEILKLGTINRTYIYGDGFAFFLAPFNSTAPVGSEGGRLGLISSNDSIKSSFVAVEFDNFPNPWDPEPTDYQSDHVGIDVNNITSVATAIWNGGSFKNATVGNAWITYDSNTHNLSAYLTFDENPRFTGESTLSYTIDLRDYLPETVQVGFSSATGQNSQITYIESWDFNSTTLSDPAPAPAPEPLVQLTPGKTSKSTKAGVIAGGVVAVIAVISIGLGLSIFLWCRRRSNPEDDDLGSDVSSDFENGTGPRRFTYGELNHATNNFAEERKLGQGGFGGVYLGFLTSTQGEIAVKKISSGSKQGKKEYTSEVKTISRLRHRNLVQLLGWCHERGDLLLVYEFLPNGSLDSHLYGGKKEPLPWSVRHKIALDLGSALVYLHEDWDQCVLHRDIKSSNIMLDANFNAKLGDFGLARLVDHEMGSQTTVLAGTFGYLAPECAITGKASKESDVYSFGVVALEIVCGRRPIEIKEDDAKMRMVEWVWGLYGKGLLLEAVDQRLEGEFNVEEAECLMMVGLWCCHPDHTLRPSISQVIRMIKLEANVPVLQSKYPVPIYSSTAMNMDIWSVTSSAGLSGSSATTNSSSSTQSHVTGTAPLLSGKASLT